MRKFLLITMMCLFGLFTVNAQETSFSYNFDDGAFQSKDDQLAFYTKLVGLGYPVNKVFEKVLKLPENEALELYQSGMRQQIGNAFSNPDLEE